jgi:hypothetical protein
MEGQTGPGELIDRLIADFQERELPRITRRDLSLPGLPGKADAVVGMRRSGKTYFLYQQIEQRLAGGIDRGRLLYLNFEDERLLPMAAADLAQIPEAFYRRFPSSREHLCWFFFDEVQNVPGWETFVRRLLDTEKVALVLTGSRPAWRTRRHVGASSARVRGVSRHGSPPPKAAGTGTTSPSLPVHDHRAGAALGVAFSFASIAVRSPTVGARTDRCACTCSGVTAASRAATR